MLPKPFFLYAEDQPFLRRHTIRVASNLYYFTAVDDVAVLEILQNLEGNIKFQRRNLKSRRLVLIQILHARFYEVGFFFSPGNFPFSQGKPSIYQSFWIDYIYHKDLE